MQDDARRPAEELKRLVLLTILLLSWTGSNLGWWLMEAAGRTSPLLRVVFGLNALFHPVMALMVWTRGLPILVIDLACLVFASSICGLCMAARFYAPAWGADIDLLPLYVWIPVIYVFTFTLPNHRLSLQLSLANLALYVIISLPYLATHRSQPEFNATLQLHMVSGVLIAALYFFSSYVHRFRDVQLNVDEMARLANTDSLTQLANRRRMSETMDAELARYARYGHPLSIITFDVDRFKEINDRFGHRVGDDLLVALAGRARGAMREVDVIGRWGGEEFVVILPETGFDETMEKAAALCHRIADQPLTDAAATPHAVTISCGIASARPGDSAEALLHRADMALYAAKKNGRNRIEGAPGSGTSPLPPGSDIAPAVRRQPPASVSS